MSRAAQTAADILVLLRRGRVASAIGQLELLPKLVANDVSQAAAEAYERGYAEGQRALVAEITGTTTAKRQPAPKQPRNLVWLAERVRDQQLRRIVLDVLKVDERHLDGVLEGRAQLSGSQRVLPGPESNAGGGLPGGP